MQLCKYYAASDSDYISGKYIKGEFRQSPEDYSNSSYRPNLHSPLRWGKQVQIGYRGVGADRRADLYADSSIPAWPAGWWTERTAIRLLAQDVGNWAQAKPVQAIMLGVMAPLSLYSAPLSCSVKCVTVLSGIAYGISRGVDALFS